MEIAISECKIMCTTHYNTHNGSQHLNCGEGDSKLAAAEARQMVGVLCDVSALHLVYYGGDGCSTFDARCSCGPHVTALLVML